MGDRVLLGIGALAGWLRLRDLDLVEFKSDEATAVDLARRVLDGELLTVGLISSTGAYNPPLFVYLSAIPLAVRDDPLAATAFVGVLSVAAVILTYFVLRPRFGALVALGTTALFATAPWAVLYGRKLWGQSLLPIAAVLLLWSMFAVLERPRTRAVGFLQSSSVSPSSSTSRRSPSLCRSRCSCSTAYARCAGGRSSRVR